MPTVPIALTHGKFSRRKLDEAKPSLSKTPKSNQEEISLFATITAAKETAKEDMAVLVELASKLKLDPLLFEAIKAAAREFEVASD